MREPLIQQAVTFLASPAAQSSPWEKTKAFLQSKGLNADEIAEAQRRQEEADGSREVRAGLGPSDGGGNADLGRTPAAPSFARHASSSSTPPVAMGTAAAPAPSSSPAGVSPAAAANAVQQVVLLLRRRIAELDHERSCYVEALRALGEPVSAEAPGTAHATLAATVAAAAHAAAPPGARPASPFVAPEVAARPSVAQSVAPLGVPGLQARKPWDTANGLPNSLQPPGAPPAATVPELEPLRDDDPDLMEILDVKKSEAS